MKVGTPNAFQQQNKILVCSMCAYRGRELPVGVQWLIKSCQTFGIQIRFFGADKPFQDMYNTKFVHLRECLEACANEYEYVISIDCADVIFLRPLEEIFSLCQDIINNKILFCAERNNYPDGNLPYPDHCKTSYKYLNGGGFISRMNQAISVMKCAKYSPWIVDQYTWACLFTSGQPIQLDSSCLIFQSLWGHGPDCFSCHNPLTNAETGLVPCILHGNGLGYTTQTYMDQVKRLYS